MDRQAVVDWLTRYVAAWKSYDPQQIGALFSENATYAYNPFDAPLQGQQAMIESWLSPKRKDEPNTYDADYQGLVVEGQTAITNGRTFYYET